MANNLPNPEKNLPNPSKETVSNLSDKEGKKVQQISKPKKKNLIEITSLKEKIKSIGSVLIELVVVVLALDYLFFGNSICSKIAENNEVRNIYHKIVRNYEEKEYYDSEKTKIKIEKTYKKGVLYSQYNYNEDGTKQKTIYYDENGKMRSESEYNNGHLIKHTAYSKNGNVWMDSEYSILEDGTKIGSQTSFYNFDKNGNISQVSIYESDGEGNTLKGTTYSADGAIEYYSIYDYDEKGNNIKTTTYNSDGSINYYYIYDYDSTGKKIRSTMYNADGSVKHYTNYQ